MPYIDYTSTIRNICRDSLDEFINTFGKTCTLWYPPVMIQCVNCVYDPIGKKSAGRWLSGGPVQFPNGATCPLCEGAGQQRAESQTSTITMIVEADPKEYNRFDLSEIRKPDGLVLGRGFMADVPNIKQCIKMQVESDSDSESVGGIIKYQYKLVGEPIDDSRVVQGRYFISLWQRI